MAASMMQGQRAVGLDVLARPHSNWRPRSPVDDRYSRPPEQARASPSRMDQPQPEAISRAP